jgi:hypothetical protein
MKNFVSTLLLVVATFLTTSSLANDQSRGFLGSGSSAEPFNESRSLAGATVEPCRPNCSVQGMIDLTGQSDKRIGARSLGLNPGTFEMGNSSIASSFVASSSSASANLMLAQKSCSSLMHGACAPQNLFTNGGAHPVFGSGSHPTLIPAPEPTAGLLLGSGLLAVGTLLRRHRRFAARAAQP